MSASISMRSLSWIQQIYNLVNQKENTHNTIQYHIKELYRGVDGFRVMQDCDYMDKILLIGVPDRPIIVRNGQQLDVKILTGNMYVASSPVNLLEESIRTTAHKAYGLFVVCDGKLRLDFLQSGASRFPEGDYKVPDNMKSTTTECHKTKIIDNANTLFFYSVMPIKKDGTPYKYKDVANLNMQIRLVVDENFSESYEQTDPNISNALFDRPLLKDDDTLIYTFSYMPMKGFNTSFKLNVQPFKLTCFSDDKDYSKSIVTLITDN